MEEGDQEDQGGVEQHGEIPEGTTGEGNQGAASSLDADRAELHWLVLKNDQTFRRLALLLTLPSSFSMACRNPS